MISSNLIYISDTLRSFNDLNLLPHNRSFESSLFKITQKLLVEFGEDFINLTILKLLVNFPPRLSKVRWLIYSKFVI